MELSIAGALICCGLLLIAQISEMPMVVASIASLAFGSTAIIVLPALGGSSPLISVVFFSGLLATVALRRDVLGSLRTVFAQQPVAWLVLILIVYTVVGTFLLPRIFAGQTTAFIPVRTDNRVAEIPLMPVSGNITQTLYFVLSALTFFAFSVLVLERPRTLSAIKLGFLVLASLHVATGFIDLFGRMGGLGDVLAPIRSASYAMHTNVEVAGFWRITGAQAEASAYGAKTVALLAFTFCYWRGTRNTYALLLSMALLALLVLSTSSTAYVAGAILAMLTLASITSAALRDRLLKQDLLLLVAACAALIVIVGIILHNDRLLDPIWRLLDTMVFDKTSSASAEERAYWNYRSLLSVYDTAGLGIGLGSSRASSWVIAVISQMGIFGSLVLGLMTFKILRGVGLRHSRELDPERRVTLLSLRATSMMMLLTASISGGGANPGNVFFMTLAVVLGLQATARHEVRNRAQPSFHPWESRIPPSVRKV